MSSFPLIPDNAPFSNEQRAWLNGFLAGMFSRSAHPVTTSAPAAAAPTLTPLTILYGSQTGSSEGLAKRAAKEAGKRGFAATVFDMAQMDLAKLAAEKNVLVITSTYGDGEPPDNAKALWEALGAATAPTLNNVRFSVCALGDTNYTQFCQCGKDFDVRLEKSGATRVAPRADCDLDFEDAYNRWIDSALTGLSVNKGAATATAAPAAPSPSAVTDKAPATDVAPTYSKNNPFPALILTSQNLSGEGSAKEVRHVEFSLEGSGLVYEAGDALGVIPQNCPELVAEVLSVLGCDGEEAVNGADGSAMSLRHALTTLYDLGKPSPNLLAVFAKATVGPGGTTAAVASTHVIDLLVAAPEIKFSPAEFVGLLKKLQPRLYSISSSPKAHPGQVHLTVGAVRYEANGRGRKGVCSTFLADRIVAGESKVGVFVHSNKAFRPPTNGDAPMIMIGPGTGIAPFRAFIHERKASGAKGHNWLFFGDQRSTTDFLYREQLETFKREGSLHRLDTAFSRDQAEKIYVQNRMLENAAELYAWLERGAHVYVCGDASRMAKDVHAALLQIIERAGGKTPEQAAAYVQNLQATKRYARDVY